MQRVIVGFGACCCGPCYLIQVYDAIADVVYDLLWTPGDSPALPEVGQYWRRIDGPMPGDFTCMLVVSVASIACDYPDYDALWALEGPYVDAAACA